MSPTVSASPALIDLIATTTLIACDWNGTLVDDADRAHVATNVALGACGYEPVSRATFHVTFRLPMDAFFLHLGVRPAETGRAVACWNQAIAGEVAPLSEGVTEFLAAASRAGLPVGVISAADEGVVRQDARRNGIETDLRFISGAAHDKAAVLTRLREQTGGVVIYIGDTEYDLQAGHRAGAVAIGFGGGYRPVEALLAQAPLLVITSFPTLADAISRSDALVRSTLATNNTTL